MEVAWFIIEVYQVKFRNYSPGYIEQAPQGLWGMGMGSVRPQSGLGVGCKLCSSSKFLVSI